MQAIEAFGRIDNNGLLKLTGPLPLKEGDVKLIILYQPTETLPEDERLWLRAVAGNPAFDFLEEEKELYSLTDGKPFSDQK